MYHYLKKTQTNQQPRMYWSPSCPSCPSVTNVGIAARQGEGGCLLYGKNPQCSIWTAPISEYLTIWLTPVIENWLIWLWLIKMLSSNLLTCCCCRCWWQEKRRRQVGDNLHLRDSITTGAEVWNLVKAQSPLFPCLSGSCFGKSNKVLGTLCLWQCVCWKGAGSVLKTQV